MDDLLTAGLLYAAISLDHVAVGQFMVSRPLVVGPLLGWFWGDPATGLFAGMIVELLWVHVIPVGIWPIDTSAVAALAVTWASVSPVSGRPGLVAALALAIPAGMAVRSVDIWTRRRNNRFVPWVSERLARGEDSALLKSLLFSLALWFTKAWLLFVVLGALGWAVLGWFLAALPSRLVDAMDWAGRLLPFLVLAVLLDYFLRRGRLSFSWSDKSPVP